MSILFFSLVFRTSEENGKLKKAFCYIHLTNWLVSRFFHYKFPFSRSHLVQKIENLVTDLPPRLRLGCKIVTRFSFSKLEDSWKTENYSVPKGTNTEWNSEPLKILKKLRVLSRNWTYDFRKDRNNLTYDRILNF